MTPNFANSAIGGLRQVARSRSCVPAGLSETAAPCQRLPPKRNPSDEFRIKEIERAPHLREPAGESSVGV